MASAPRVDETLTLEEFLKRPAIDEHPYQEFIDGRIELKVSPQTKHSMVTKRLVQALDAFAVPARLGESFPELRCTFAGRSIVPDVAFLVSEHIVFDAQGMLVNEVSRPPDIHVEIVFPDQSLAMQRQKLAHSTTHGCQLGLLIDPERESVDVFHDGQARRLQDHETIAGEPVLPGFRLPVAEIFRWLRRHS